MPHLKSWSAIDCQAALAMHLFVQVKPFGTPSEVDAWLYDNPMHCPGALHFTEKDATVISYGIQTNSTPLGKRGTFEDPTFKFQVPLQLAAEREIARSLIGGISSCTLMFYVSYAYMVIYMVSNALASVSWLV